jgi:hypothetical protein
VFHQASYCRVVVVESFFFKYLEGGIKGGEGAGVGRVKVCMRVCMRVCIRVSGREWYQEGSGSMFVFFIYFLQLKLNYVEGVQLCLCKPSGGGGEG